MEVDIAEEIGIVERVDTAAGRDVVEYSGTAEDIAAAGFHNLIDSCRCFVHIQDYWCFGADNFRHHHHGLMHLLDL